VIVQAKNNRKIFLRRFKIDDIDQLFQYLQHLSSETRKRFGPHHFDKQSIIDFYKNADEYLSYVAQDIDTSELIAYSIIRIGYLEHDHFRLQSYGLSLDNKTDCTFAPSVADEWQSCGVGDHLFSFICTELKGYGIQRIILWGGVQCDNRKAVNFYHKNGFRTLGHFEYSGQNMDMILENL